MTNWTKGRKSDLDRAQHLLRIIRQANTQMVMKSEAAIQVPAGIERQFCIRRAALNERSSGIVTDSANDRSTDAGRADDRMRLAAIRFEPPFERIQRST